MLKRIFRPCERITFPADLKFQMSADGQTGEVVPATPQVLPPVTSFDVDNLLKAGVSLQPIFNFIESPIEQNMDTLNKIEEQINIYES